MTGTSLTQPEMRALEHAEKYLSKGSNSIDKITKL